MRLRPGTPGVLLLAIPLLVAARAAVLVPNYEIHLAGDAFGYISSADHLIETGVLPALSYQSKSFSIILAALFSFCSDYLECVRLSHIMMDAILVLFMSLSACYFLRAHPGLAFLSVLVIAMQPFTILHANGIYPDHACQFFTFTGAVLVYLGLFHGRSAAWVVPGACLLGLAGLARQDLLPVNLVILAVLLGGAWLSDARARARTTGIAALAAFCFALPPAGFLALQAYSSSELGFARPSVSDNPGTRYGGYSSWLRSWVAFERSEHNVFAWEIGEPGWPGFEPGNYPDRAFGTEDEKSALEDLIGQWREEGYTRDTDRGFEALSQQRCAPIPLYCELFLPAIRMLGLWFNLDGAQVIISLLGLERPVTTLVVGATLLVRLSFILLAAWSAAVLVARPRLLEDRERIILTACLSALFLRTVEIGILGTFSTGISWAGLVEARYATPVFPFLIVAALIGLSTISRLAIRPR